MLTARTISVAALAHLFLLATACIDSSGSAITRDSGAVPDVLPGPDAQPDGRGDLPSVGDAPAKADTIESVGDAPGKADLDPPMADAPAKADGVAPKTDAPFKADGPGPATDVAIKTDVAEAGPDTAGKADGPGGSDGPNGYTGLPQPICVWNEAYQENYAADTVSEILAGARHCYVLIDPFANSDARDAIASMKQAGNTVGCYISVGTCEDWRDDFSAMKPYCVSKQWGQWPGEYFVDRTDPALVALMKARIDKMATWGCNMVELDNMDWTFDPSYRSQYGITATEAEGEAYNRTLCAYMHEKGMGCMAKSSAQGANDFDGLTVESSPGDLNWWTPSDMSGMLSSGKIGIVVHYNETDCAGVRATYQDKYGAKLSFICEDRALKKYRHFP